MDNISPNDIAKILRGFAKDLAEANAYIVAAILSEHPNPDAVLKNINAVLNAPELAQNPIAHDYLHYVMNCLVDSGSDAH